MRGNQSLAIFDPIQIHKHGWPGTCKADLQQSAYQRMHTNRALGRKSARARARERERDIAPPFPPLPRWRGGRGGVGHRAIVCPPSLRPPPTAGEGEREVGHAAARPMHTSNKRPVREPNERKDATKAGNVQHIWARARTKSRGQEQKAVPARRGGARGRRRTRVWPRAPPVPRPPPPPMLECTGTAGGRRLRNKEGRDGRCTQGGGGGRAGPCTHGAQRITYAHKRPHKRHEHGQMKGC